MDIPEWLVRCGSVLLAGIAFTMTFDSDAVSSPAWLIISQGLLLVLLTQLLLPAARSPGHLLANSVAGAAVMIILDQLPIAASVPMAILLRVCVVIFCLSLLLWSLRQLLQTVCGGVFKLRDPVLLLAAVTAAAPVWLGPFVELVQPGDGAISGILSITPLTHFAVAAQYDYLRSVWFYRNTPFGSLPFAYPGLISIVAAYLIAVLCLQMALWRTTRYKLNLNILRRRSLTIS